MGLKRLPADLTFEAVRNQTSPLARNPPKVVDIARTQPVPSSDEDDLKAPDDEVGEVAPSAAARVIAPAIKADHAGREPVRHDQPDAQPTGEEKPGMVAPVSAADKLDARQGDQLPARPPMEETMADTRSREASKVARPVDETVILKARVLPPVDGVIEVHDLVKARHGDKAALKHLLGLALASYEAAVLADDPQASGKQPDYTSHPPSHVSHCSRAVSKPFFEAAKAALDPMGIMGPTVLASAIVKNAIAWYIVVEMKKTF